MVDWFDSDWEFRKKFTVDATKVSDDETNFAVEINQTVADLVGEAQSDGDDFRITTSDGTTEITNRHLVSYDDATGALVMWFLAPSISGSTDTDFYLYYGNASATDNSTPTGAYPSDMVAAYHLNAANTTTTSLVDDATSNANHGYVMGTRTYLDFDGVNDLVNCGSDSSIDDIFTGGGTIGATITPRSDGELNEGRILDKRSGNTNGWLVALTNESSGFVKLSFRTFWSGDNGTWETTDAVIPLNVPTKIIIKFDDGGTSNNPTFYINGIKYTVGSGLTESATPTGTMGSDAAVDLHIGNIAATSVTFDGGISDVWLDTSEISDADALQDYNTHDLDYSSFTAYYPLDEISGTSCRNAGAGGAGAGTNSGATITEGALDYGARPVWDSGLSKHLDFDGTNDYVDFGDDTDFEFGSNPFTIMGWVVIDNYSDANTIFAKWLGTGNQREYAFQTKLTTGELQLLTTDTGSGTNTRVAGTPIPLGVPVHVAVTKSGTDATFYINGVADTDDSTALDGTVYTGTALAVFGAISDGGAQFIEGKSWNVMVYNGTALSQAQIDSARTTGEPPTTTNLVLHAKMNEISGTQVHDYSGNGNHGTNSGATITDGNLSYGSGMHWREQSSHLDFDGVNDIVTVTRGSDDDDLFSGGGTVAFTVSQDSGAGRDRIINNLDSNSGWMISSQTSKIELNMQYDATDGIWITDDVVLNYGTPTRIVVTYDSDSNSNDPVVYINGESVAITKTSTPSGTPLTNTASSILFGGKSAGSENFDGKIWNVVLDPDSEWSAAEALADATTLVDHSDKSGWWKINEGTGNVANSGTGNSGTGTVSGATWTTGRTFQDGKFINGGINLEGVSSHVRVPHLDALDGVAEYSIFSIQKQIIIDVEGGLYSQGTSDTNKIDETTNAAGNWLTQIRTGGADWATYDYSGSVTADIVFSHGTAYNGAGATDADKLASYYDGSSVSLSYTGVFDATTPTTLGGSFNMGYRSDSFGPDYWNGNISELFILDTAKDADWQSTMHEMTINNSTFLTFAAEETEPPPAATGVILEGDHSKAFYGDVRFDRIRTREERLYIFPAIGRIKRHEKLTLQGKILYEHRLPNITSKISKITEMMAKSKIQRLYESYIEASIIDKETGTLHKTISQTIEDLREQRKRAKLSKMLKDYQNEFLA